MFMLGGESADCFMINPEVEPKKQAPYILTLRVLTIRLTMGLFLVKKYTCVYMDMCIHVCV